jgi:MFS family permease
MMLGISVATTLSGRSIARTGRYKRFPVAGLALMTVGLLLLAVFSGDPSRTTTGIAIAGYGLGFGMVTQVLIVAVQNSVDRRQLGVATATTGFFRALGAAVGAAALGAVFASRAGTHVSAGVHALSAQSRADIVDAVQTVFVVAAPLAALALLAVLSLPEQPLQTGQPGAPAARAPERGEREPGAQSAERHRPGSSGAVPTATGAEER